MKVENIEMKDGRIFVLYSFEPTEVGEALVGVRPPSMVAPKPKIMGRQRPMPIQAPDADGVVWRTINLCRRGTSCRIALSGLYAAAGKPLPERTIKYAPTVVSTVGFVVDFSECNVLVGLPNVSGISVASDGYLMIGMNLAHQMEIKQGANPVQVGLGPNGLMVNL